MSRESGAIHSVYRLLRELKLRDSGSSLSESWDCYSDPAKLVKEKYRQELLELVKRNPAKVVATVYHWANEGVGHNAKISDERERVFNLFFLIESERSLSKIDRLN